MANLIVSPARESVSQSVIFISHFINFQSISFHSPAKRTSFHLQWELHYKTQQKGSFELSLSNLEHFFSPISLSAFYYCWLNDNMKTFQLRMCCGAVSRRTAFWSGVIFNRSLLPLMAFLKYLPSDCFICRNERYCYSLDLF